MTGSTVLNSASSAQVAPRAEKAAGLSYQKKVRLAQIGFVLLLVIIAEIVTRLGNVSHDLFPPPSVILVNVVGILQDAGVGAALLILLAQLVTAFILSILIGAVTGYLVGAWIYVEKITLPILLLIYSIPQVTLLPLFVLYFGPGFGSKVAFGVSHGMFPIALAVVAGLNQARANPIYARWAASLGASEPQKLMRVQLPQAVGAILIGLRLSMSTTLLGVLLADLYISTHGVGYYARVFTETLQGPKLFALIIVLATLAIIINGLVSRLEAYSSRWKG
jgi:ABC-type nitrate/sulfonate/bicarbonate transport system permease component